MTGKVSEKELSPKLKDRLTQQSERLESIEGEFLKKYENLPIKHGVNIFSDRIAGLPSLSIKGRTVVNHAPLFNSGLWKYRNNDTSSFWAISGSKATLESDLEHRPMYIYLTLNPDTHYTVSLISNGRLTVREGHDYNSTSLLARIDVGDLELKHESFTTPSDGLIVIRLDSGATPREGVFTFENLCLVKGDEPKEFVNGFQPIRNPMLESVGKNLLPQTNWIQATVTSGGLDGTFNEFRITTPVIRVKNGETYTLSGVEDLEWIVVGFDYIGGTRYLHGANNDDLWVVGDHPITIPANTNAVRFIFRKVDKSEISIVTDIPHRAQFEVGSQSTEFEPQRKSRTYYPELVLASSEDGSMYDELLPSDEVVKRFDEIQITADLGSGWQHIESFADYKRVRTTIQHRETQNPVMSKYNCKLLEWVIELADLISPDMFVWAVGSGNLHITVSNQNSGWGDDYAPTEDEVKAYFNGWRMHTRGNRVNLYNGTGEKVWYPVTRTNASENPWNENYARYTVPAVDDVADNKDGWQFYKLQYQLAEPRIEKVNPVGRIQLHKGNNQIEVVEGFIGREKVFPTGDAGNLFIGDTAQPAGLLKHRPLRILSIYRNTDDDTHNWMLYNSGINMQGEEKARIIRENFDPTATYYVDYIMMDTASIEHASLHVPTSLVSQVERVEAILSDESIGQDRGLVQRVDSLQGDMSNLQEDMQEVFTSVDNGKRDLCTAIIGKGGVVSGTQPNSFEELVTGIESISPLRQGFGKGTFALESDVKSWIYPGRLREDEIFLLEYNVNTFHTGFQANSVYLRCEIDSDGFVKVTRASAEGLTIYGYFRVLRFNGVKRVIRGHSVFSTSSSGSSVYYINLGTSVVVSKTLIFATLTLVNESSQLTTNLGVLKHYTDFGGSDRLGVRLTPPTSSQIWWRVDYQLLEFE